MKMIVYKFIRLVVFILYFIAEIILASMKVALCVMRPHPILRPGIIAIPLSCNTNLEITIFANMLSLTPGTLVLDVSEDKKTLYVHEMFIEDKDQLIKNIKRKFETPIIGILR